MKNLLFGMFGHDCLMAPEDGNTGENGGGGGGGGGTSGGGDGGQGGDNGETFATTGGDGGEGGEGGATGGALANAGKGGEGGEGEGTTVDWDSMTDEKYFEGFEAPAVDGVEMNMEHVKKTYGAFLRKYHIPQEALKEYLEMEGKAFRKAYDTSSAKNAEELKAIKENFEAQGEALKKNFNEAQIETAVSTLATFSSDEDFMKIATTNLSNNSTLVKLLLNWAEHHKADGTAGAGNGQGGSPLSGFAERWTGKKM